MKAQGGAGCWWWRDDSDLLASRSRPTPLAGRKQGSLRTRRRALRRVEALRTMKRASLGPLLWGSSLGKGSKGGLGPLWAPQLPRQVT